MFLPVLQSNPTSWQGQTTKLCTTWPPESRQPAWLHQSSSALYSPPTLATTTLDFPISKPRISPSAKSAAPSRILIPAIRTWPSVYAKSPQPACERELADGCSPQWHLSIDSPQCGRCATFHCCCNSK